MKFKTNTTQARLKELFFYDPLTGHFTWRETFGARVAGRIAGKINATGHRQLSVDGSLFMAHRLAWLYVYGEWPRALIDHINRVHDDNRLANLRQATFSQNNQNVVVYKNSVSGFKGVTWNSQRGKWAATICLNKRNYHLGFFVCPREAYAAYVAGAARFHTANPVVTEAPADA